MTKQVKNWIIVGVILLVVVIIYSSFKGTYNKIVTTNEAVGASWSQVENQYQRRSDLIPNLVNTVKGYAEHESTTLEGVVEARAKATQVTLDVNNLDEASIAKYQKAQGEISSALGRLMAISEAYPDLKANENFMQLQAQLEGTENRIATERKRFNETVKDYNTYIRTFPRNLIANMFGFTAKGYFAAEQGAEKAPEVKF
ncbi:MAG: LemA family protein [Rikenellaceae bacterium]